MITRTIKVNGTEYTLQYTPMDVANFIINEVTAVERKLRRIPTIDEISICFYTKIQFKIKQSDMIKLMINYLK